MVNSDVGNETPPLQVLLRWKSLNERGVARLTEGLINTTFLVGLQGGDKAILQRLHTVFDAAVNCNIAAVTAHLVRKGMATPRLLPTDDGALWVEEGGAVWRALTFVPGRTYGRIETPGMALEAGRVVGRFHAALADFHYEYRALREGVHDTRLHLERLERAIDRERGHRLRDSVAPLGDSILRAQDRLPDFSGLPQRHAHGDLKVSNIVFDPNRNARCLIDLDTLGPMAWPLEMGDALRSWCNPCREEDHAARFDLELFGAAVSGYASTAGGLVSDVEWDALLSGLERICLELTARFAADALTESYFGWDPGRYAARGEHNLDRARAMWALFCSVCRRRLEAERLLRSLRS